MYDLVGMSFLSSAKMGEVIPTVIFLRSEERSTDEMKKGANPGFPCTTSDRQKIHCWPVDFRSQLVQVELGYDGWKIVSIGERVGGAGECDTVQRRCDAVEYLVEDLEGDAMDGRVGGGHGEWTIRL
jgi:hypothetical protein